MLFRRAPGFMERQNKNVYSARKPWGSPRFMFFAGPLALVSALIFCTHAARGQEEAYALSGAELKGALPASANGKDVGKSAFVFDSPLSLKPTPEPADEKDKKPEGEAKKTESGENSYISNGGAEASQKGAETASSDGGARIESGGELEGIEAMGFGLSASPLTSPSNNTLISRQDIISSSASTAAQILKDRANLIFRSTTSNYATGDFAMRGFGENSANRVLVLVDGHRLSRIDSGSINWAQIPLAHIESIEVLRGSHSAEYGSGAVAGVILINTLKGSDINELSASAAYGSYDYNLFNADFIGREGPVYGTVNANSYYDGGYRENSRSWSNGVGAALGYDVSDSTTIEIGGNFSDSMQQYPGPLQFDYLGRPALDDPQSSIVSDSSGRTKAYLATLNIDSETSAGVFGMESGFNLLDMQWSNSGAYSKNDQWTASAFPKYTFDFSDTFEVSVGADLSYDSVDVRRYLDSSFKDNHANADMQRMNFAPFLKARKELFDNLTLTVAGRFDCSHIDAYSVEYDPKTVPEYIFIRGEWRKNPYPLTKLSEESHSKWLHGFGANFGANWRLTEKSSLFFRFDQIYRYPTSNEIFAYEGYVLAKVFQDDLKPETGQNYEFGWKYMDQNWSVIVNLFVQRLEDEISYDDAERLNVNLDPTLRYGADFELRYDEPLWGASLLASVTRAEFMEGQYSGRVVPLVPLANGTLSAYVNPIDMVRLTARINGLTTQYQGGDYYNSQMKIPAYATLDFQVDFLLCDNFRVFISADNILDKRYISAAWWGSGAYPGVGRTFKIGASVRF